MRVNQANKAAGGGAQVIVKNQGTSCAKCSQPLQGEIVDAFGSTFHKGTRGGAAVFVVFSRSLSQPALGARRATSSCRRRA